MTPDLADPLALARAAADRLLRVRPRSEQELRQRLRQQGCAEAAVEHVVQTLTRRGALNDLQFAQYVAASRLHARPSGIRALRQELRRRGIAGPVADQALGQAAAGYDELAAARALVARRRASWDRLPPAVAQRRAAGLLQRRGFSHDVIYRVVRDVSH